jgi:iron(III) transport system permease protein
MGLAAGVLVMLASDRLRGLLANSAILAGGVLAIAAPIGAGLGILLAKVDLPGRRIVGWLLAAMLFVPLYVQTAAWNALLGGGGLIPQALAGEGYAQPWLEGWRAAVWVHAMGATPWIALLTAASLRAVERRIEEESLLDASPVRVLGRVSLARGAGGAIAAALWTAVICCTEITVTDFFQIRTFAEEIYTEASLGALTGASGAIAARDLAIGVTLLAMLVVVALALLAPWLPKAASASQEACWTWRPRRLRLPLAATLWAGAALILVVPLVGLAWKAGVSVHQQHGQYVRTWSAWKVAAMVLGSPWEHRREWAWSLAVGGLAAVSATALAVLAAWWARLRIRGGWGLAVAAAVGLAVPAPLWGVWTIELLNHPPESPLAPLTMLYDHTLLAPVLVQLARALPLAMLWMGSQLATIPQDLLDASRSEAANWGAQLVRIALPMRLPGVLMAAALSLVIAVGELSATILVLPPGVTTVSVRVFQLIHYGVDDRVAALCLSCFALLGAGAALTAAGRRWAARRQPHVAGRPIG